MSTFRSDSLYQKLTQEQRDQLMLAMLEAKRDRAGEGFALVNTWQVKTSRSAVHAFFARYSFGWRLERAAFVAQHTEAMPDFTEAQRHLVAQKLFAEAADTDADPKFLLFLRSLELQEEKLKQKDAALKLAREKFKESLRSKLDTAMEALKTAIEKNPVAQEAFAKLKEAVQPA